MLTIALGVGVVGGLANVNQDMNRKMGLEFRAYGANLLVYPQDGAARIDAEAAAALQQQLAGDRLVGLAPLQYGIFTAETKQFVLAGTVFAQMRAVSPYWQVEGGWADDRNDSAEAMVGTEIASEFALHPGSVWNVTCPATGAAVKLAVKGIVTTGGKEDGQAFIPLPLMHKLTGSDQANTVLVSLLEKGDALESRAAALEAAIPGISVKPLKQMAQSEAALVVKIGRLIFIVSTVVFGTTALTVTTAMISMVMERRNEIGLKKAIGAPDGRLIGELLAEGAVLGLSGCIFGLGLARIVAQIIGRTVFHADIAFQAAVIPWAVLGTLLAVAVAFIAPVKRMLAIEPAVVLKGE